MGISIREVGIGNLIARLTTMPTAIVEAVDTEMEAWAEETRQALKSTPYPPAPPKSRYVRTGVLASSWRKVRLGVGKWALQNYASEVRRKGVRVYPQFVLDEENQAWMHRGRWWTAQDRIRGLAAGLPGRIARAIMARWARP